HGTLFETRHGLEFLKRTLPCRRFEYQKDPLGYHPLKPGPEGPRLDGWVQKFVSQANAQVFEAEPLIHEDQANDSLTERLRALGYLD
ncbi:unnamed protein product, partial [marine sediment metagenome]